MQLWSSNRWRLKRGVTTRTSLASHVGIWERERGLLLPTKDSLLSVQCFLTRPSQTVMQHARTHARTRTCDKCTVSASQGFASPGSVYGLSTAILCRLRTDIEDWAVWVVRSVELAVVHQLLVFERCSSKLQRHQPPVG